MSTWATVKKSVIKKRVIKKGVIKKSSIKKGYNEELLFKHYVA